MKIKVGDRIPKHEFLRVNNDGGVDLISTDMLSDGRSVLVGVPGAFTPKCTAVHIPSFVDAKNEFASRGTKIAIVSVNDHMVMSAWLKSIGAVNFLPLSDWDASFVEKLGLAVDFSAWNMGVRSERFAIVATNGEVENVFIDYKGAVEDTLAENVLKHI